MESETVAAYMSYTRNADIAALVACAVAGNPSAAMRRWYGLYDFRKALALLYVLTDALQSGSVGAGTAVEEAVVAGLAGRLLHASLTRVIDLHADPLVPAVEADFAGNEIYTRLEQWEYGVVQTLGNVEGELDLLDPEGECGDAGGMPS